MTTFEAHRRRPERRCSRCRDHLPRERLRAPGGFSWCASRILCRISFLEAIGRLPEGTAKALSDRLGL